MAGQGGGTLKTGRYLMYPKNTPACNLYKSMLQRMGTPLERFGDSTGELAGIDDESYSAEGMRQMAKSRPLKLFEYSSRRR